MERFIHQYLSHMCPVSLSNKPPQCTISSRNKAPSIEIHKTYRSPWMNVWLHDLCAFGQLYTQVTSVRGDVCSDCAQYWFLVGYRNARYFQKEGSVHWEPSNLSLSLDVVVVSKHLWIPTSVSRHTFALENDMTESDVQSEVTTSLSQTVTENNMHIVKTHNAFRRKTLSTESHEIRRSHWTPTYPDDLCASWQLHRWHVFTREQGERD
jgi:hypothetical protein